MDLNNEIMPTFADLCTRVESGWLARPITSAYYVCSIPGFLAVYPELAADIQPRWKFDKLLVDD